MKLIIITGLPCTGKTTLGHTLSEKLQFPFFSKDNYKEIMFDASNQNDKKDTTLYQTAPYKLLFSICEQNLKIGNSLIIESNFLPEFSDNIFLDFQKKYNFQTIQIRCHTQGDILFERFQERALTGKRHICHNDIAQFDRWKPVLLQGTIEALNIGGELIDLNTTDFNAIDYHNLYIKIMA